MEEILSIGIDIGTTTTQVILSKLTLKNTAGSFVIPRVEITEKEILYRSKIHFTPILEQDMIDALAIKRIIEEEFLQSGFKKEDIYSGAIILTGETARKQNAEEVVHNLSQFAGDFVVATAGPDYEATLAGYGSGAQTLSKEMNTRVVNFDIGGGTTNACVFDKGEIIDCYALDIGGRLIRFSEDKKVIYISKRLEKLIGFLQLEIVVGQPVDFETIARLTQGLAEIFVALMGLEILSEESKTLFIDHENQSMKIKFATFSGGVAEYIYSNETMEDWEALLCHMDMGPQLGYAIRERMSQFPELVLVPKEKIRATVIGAGNHSLHISGSTVSFDEEDLPIKNIPIVKVNELVVGQMDLIKKRMHQYKGASIALAFNGIKNQTYEEVKNLSDLILELYEEVEEGPIIVIVLNDFAKALGQTLKRKNRSKRGVICLDNIRAENGDYVDIGKPISGVVPVIIKTLIFN